MSCRWLNNYISQFIWVCNYVCVVWARVSWRIGRNPFSLEYDQKSLVSRFSFEKEWLENTVGNETERTATLHQSSWPPVIKQDKHVLIGEVSVYNEKTNRMRWGQEDSNAEPWLQREFWCYAKGQDKNTAEQHVAITISHMPDIHGRGLHLDHTFTHNTVGFASHRNCCHHRWLIWILSIELTYHFHFIRTSKRNSFDWAVGGKKICPCKIIFQMHRSQTQTMHQTLTQVLLNVLVHSSSWRKENPAKPFFLQNQ